MSWTGSDAAAGVLVGKIDDSEPAEMLMGEPFLLVSNDVNHPTHFLHYTTKFFQ